MRVIAYIENEGVARRILAHLGLPTTPPTFAAARAPPQTQFDWGKRPSQNKWIVSSQGARRMDRVIPLSVEDIGLEIYERELIVRDPTTLRIDALIDSALHA